MFIGHLDNLFLAVFFIGLKSLFFSFLIMNPVFGICVVNLFIFFYFQMILMNKSSKVKYVEPNHYFIYGLYILCSI